MRFKALPILTILLVALVGCGKIDQPPLIDRELFFGDPEISSGKLSPDGEYIAFLKPYNGTRNIWVKSREASFNVALPITAKEDRPIRSYFWSGDGRYILFIQDNAGDENFNVYAISPKDATEGEIPVARNLTNLQDVRVQIYHISRKDHDLMFIGLNDRDKVWHDLYSLKISTGELKLLKENNNRYTDWVFDHNDNLRLAKRSRVDGTNELWRMDTKGQTLLFSSSMFETAYPIAFTKDNRHFYMVSNVGDDLDLTQLYLMDVETGKFELVEGDPDGKADFGRLVLSERTFEPLYTTYTDAYTRRYFKDNDFERHFRSLQAKFEGLEVNLYGATSDERYWLVSVWSDTNPSDIYIYDMTTEELTFQYNPRSTLPTEHLSKMKSITYQSSDGLEIQAYLTIPKGFGEEQLPLVVLPHGGPWARDRWTYNSYVQFLANRGYAVLQPNFRGSRGFGKQFLNAGNGQWGDLMQDDITYGVKYLIDEGVVDKDRIGIFGISYGGYATLAGLAFTPSLYACGVSFVGHSNLLTLLNSIPPYWESIRTSFYERIGNPNNDEGIAQLKRQSPLFSADQIAAPLLVVQGENDPRVRKAESDQIVIALRDRGFPVEYISAPDEGHGFVRPINNMAFIAAMEKFFATHLGGRYQKDIPQEVAERLQEITVDVHTVSLADESQ
ncbi:MAG: S9 family peptidase [Bacteroidales bacterium]|nr:S9 family peptidase [Bacteroidales bacterium]